MNTKEIDDALRPTQIITHEIIEAGLEIFERAVKDEAAGSATDQ
ncbi:MAG: hypothetical protein ABSC50_03330 [Candidatus Bathyarchaeia archaeon]